MCVLAHMSVCIIKIGRVKEKSETVGRTRGLFTLAGRSKTKHGERSGMYEMMDGLQENTGGKTMSGGQVAKKCDE